MASKRGASPGGLVQNPFIKKRNLEWNLDVPGSGTRDATESHSFRTDDTDVDDSSNEGEEEDAASSSKRDDKESGGGGANNLQPSAGTSAAASASAASTMATGPAVPVASEMEDRARATTLSPFPAGAPRLAVERWRALYERSWGSARGAHFVVHQHDHPVAGLHYDLRLQINATSSASWAVTYGLPGGDPNPNPNNNGAPRQNRNAIETRVHCLSNHLMETGSHTNGSLLIWDTGTYSVLPPERDDSQSPPPPPSPPSPPPCDSSPSEQENLSRAFRARKIRLRLRGARLPDPYVINLRLPLRDASFTTSTTTTTRGRKRRNTAPPEEEQEQDREQEEKEKEQEKEQEEKEMIRRTNAYPGATNSIGSVHQRRWFLSLDRAGSGFVARKRGKGRKVVWEEREGGGDGEEEEGEGEGEGEGENRLTYPFYVGGLETERSVVTGRLAREVLRDEGVVGYVSRRGWRGVR
ncbi:hypothetical protein F5X96DRAFT_692928 [Biscogniauxia mediterranea]|nr:hypothetical protein F5X96DRAFT_692928 [Biscogniauxia mediterranea]